MNKEIKIDANNFKLHFFNWLKANEFIDGEEDLKFSFWNVDTSIPSYLNELFLHAKKVACLSVIPAEKDGDYLIEDEFPGKNPMSFARLHQLLRVGLFFNMIKIEYTSDMKYKTLKSFIEAICEKNIILKYNETLGNYNDYYEYLINNLKEISASLKTLIVEEQDFAKEWTINLLAYLFVINKYFNEDIDHDNLLLIVDKFKDSKRTVSANLILFLKTFMPIKGFINVFVNGINEGIKGFVDENVNEDIGYAGEFVFNLIIKSWNKYKTVFKNNSAYLGDVISQYKWISQEKRMNPYDFELNDGTKIVEVKTTRGNPNKANFRISIKEFEKMKEYEKSGFVCYIKNIDLNIIDFENKKLIDDSFVNENNIIFYRGDDIIKKFNLRPIGFFASEY
jgi:hypothetical protein